jgi:hypothetical protein
MNHIDGKVFAIVTGFSSQGSGWGNIECAFWSREKAEERLAEIKALRNPNWDEIEIQEVEIQ